MRRVRITDFYKKSSLETVLCWSFFAVSAFLLFLSMGITMYYDIAKERRDVDAAISDTAAYVATMPEVAGMLEKGYPDEAVRRELDFFCSNSSTLNLMVICDSDGLRFYHTDRNTTGETVTGGDEADILAGSPPYITTGYGSMGMQRRAFHSVRDSQGEIIGYVMASVFTDYLSDRQTNIVTLYLSVLGLMLVMSFLLSRALVVFLRGRLMGHEPEELLDIYIRQDAVLNSLSEGLVAVDPTGTVLYANESAAGFFRVSGSPDSLEGKAVRKPSSRSGAVLVADGRGGARRSEPGLRRGRAYAPYQGHPGDRKGFPGGDASGAQRQDRAPSHVGRALRHAGGAGRSESLQS